VKDVADFLKIYDIQIKYVAAHVGGLISGDTFQEPLREGVDTMTMSTHKTLFGPQGGLVLAFEKDAEAIKKATFPGLTSSHHIHHMAAKAVTFAEVLEFGKDYASQTIKNAKALAVTLNDLGFKVLGEKKGFTQSHQTVVNVLDYGDGGKIEADLEKANIIVNRQLIPGDIKAKRHYMHPGGIRLGTSEVTRLGMKEPEMEQIASFIKNVVVDNKDAKDTAKQIAEFRKNYQKVQYCFDNKLGAYEYVKLR
jgi:glycine hydroxymethyltransferase